MPDRITKSYRPGKGDDGYSEFLSGYRVSKSSATAHLFGAVEKTRNAASRCIRTISQPDVAEDLVWLTKTIQSIIAFAWCQGDSTDHLFPEDFSRKITEKVAEWWPVYGGSPEFQIWVHPNLLEIDSLRLEIRAMECWYTGWRESPEMKRKLATPLLAKITKLLPRFIRRSLTATIQQRMLASLRTDHQQQRILRRIRYQALVLNRLSSWVWCVENREGFILHKEEKIERLYWQGMSQTKVA
ncbi:MAG: hypothetical protein WBB28_01350 [Crinalium sp.]